jgi:hypothetical protein
VAATHLSNNGLALLQEAGAIQQYIEAWQVPMLTDTDDLSDFMLMNGRSEGKSDRKHISSTIQLVSFDLVNN